MPRGVYCRKERRPSRSKADRENGCLYCGNKYLSGKFQFKYCSAECYIKHDIKSFMERGFWVPIRLKQKKPFNKHGLLYEPRTEDEVLFLFAKLHKKLGFKNISIIRREYPDCIAIDYKGRSIRIEFELNSKSFNHDIKGCDLIICWEHEWEKCPLKVISLKEVLLNNKNSKEATIYPMTKIKKNCNVEFI